MINPGGKGDYGGYITSADLGYLIKQHDRAIAKKIRDILDSEFTGEGLMSTNLRKSDRFERLICDLTN